MSTLGVDANPGTVAAPLRSITAALALAAANGDLGTVPVTINLMDPAAGAFTEASGEGFPITLPAHGVAIEVHEAVGGVLPLVDATASAVRDTFLFDSLGNPALPESVLRGLNIVNGAAVPESTHVRIEVPLGGAAAPQNVGVEIRDCEIDGVAAFGIDIVSTAGVSLVPVIERNTIESVGGSDAIDGVGVRVTGGTAACSPVIRSNEIQGFPVNLLIQGGGLTNQPRVQSNFIQVGGVNVRCNNSAPFVIGNTIAFAAGPDPIGVDLINVTTMTFANNLLWNPVQPGSAVNPVDINGNAAVVQANDRLIWFNYDEDDILSATASPNYGPAGLGAGPNFVGGDVGTGQVASDLHLNDVSFLRELAVPIEYTVGPGLFPENVLIPGAPTGIVVRREHAHDADFDARVSGLWGDIGADEVTALVGNPAFSLTRGATLEPRIGSITGADIDSVGNLRPAPGGAWATEVVISGEPGDFALLMSGVGFDDFVTDPAFPGVAIENTAVFQNLLANGTVLAGMVSSSNLSVPLGAGSVTVAFVPIPANGAAVVGVNFGAANATFAEGEAHLQAVVFDPTFTRVQSTNRISLDLNE